MGPVKKILLIFFVLAGSVLSLLPANAFAEFKKTKIAVLDFQVQGSRDEAADLRLQIMSETDGTARCHTAFNCTEACPRDIKITRAIGEVKLAMVTGKLK